MIDIGFTKLLIVGGIALVVIGPERLPRVARTLGALIGRAQRYVSDVKAEVSRSIELEEINKMRQEFDSAARDVHAGVSGAADDLTREVDDALRIQDNSSDSPLAWTPEVGPVYEHPRKNWRLKRGALPQWYKRQSNVRGHVQSGAARVARHRPPGLRR